MDVTYKQLATNSWRDAVTTITAMLSTEGRVSPNPRSGYLTVTDIPERLLRVEDFVNKINDKARRKIAVKVDVFNIELSSKTDYGINWDAVIGAWGGDIALDSINGGVSPLSNLATPIETMKFTYAGSGFFDTADFIFGALSRQGDTTVVTGTTVYTVNGEPAPVQVVTRSDYVKEITFSAISDQSSTTEVAITPGTVVSGFFMVITPTILSDNQILLNLSLSLSTADTTSPDRKETICPSGQTDKALCPSITLPEVKSKNFMESVTLNPGQTVILSGFQELDNKVGVESIAAPSFWMLGGAKATNSTKTTTVTVITPYVVGR
jgi:type IVB pilus formation R64 PilN family outer membrane protein